MKEIKIFFDSYFLEKVLEEVKEYGVRKYMLIPKMFSDWGEKLKHFDNHLWPGTDSMIIIYVADEQSSEIMRAIKAIKSDVIFTLFVRIKLTNQINEISYK